VNIFLATVIESLDRIATKLGVTRQSVIKVWLAERLELTASNASLHRMRAGTAAR